MRLINVDDLGVGRCSKDVLPAAYCAGWNGLLGLIEKAPTVDAVVVTRCKGCKYAYINSFAVSSGEALCTLSGKPMQQDDFAATVNRRRAQMLTITIKANVSAADA